MHISIHDVEHTEYHRKGRIFVDGREVNQVIEASEEGGFVVRYKDGCIMEHLNNPSLATERLTGKVEIKLEDEL